MTVRTRLSLFCSIVFGVIFAIISLLIYALSLNNAEASIYKGLEKTAYISAFFYLEEDELNAHEFEKIRHQFEDLVPESSFQFYDANNTLTYGQAEITISTEILEKIRKLEKHRFRTDTHLCYGIFYKDNQGDFVIITKEDRAVLDAQMAQLLYILLASFLIGLLAIILLSKWVSRVAYRPFSEVIDQVKNISTSDKTMQIASPNTHDELQSLIDTFNRLLAKISENLVIQKNFVNYVSHEFKTPLASLLGNLEVFSIKDRSPQEYEDLSHKLIGEIYQLQEILDTLMVVSDLRKDTDAGKDTRVDELVWEILSKLSARYPKAKVDVNIDVVAGDEAILSVATDRTQLVMALLNLIENSMKYAANKPIDIRLYKHQERLCLLLCDKGIGIPSQQLELISKPFYRAENVDQVQGSGIGLSIALRILEKNNIHYTITSNEGEGTAISLLF